MSGAEPAAGRIETVSPSDRSVEKASLSAAHLAVAIVTACRLRGRHPEKVFEAGQDNRRARILAAGGLAARLGLKKAPIAALLKVFPQELAPSMLGKVGVTTDELLEIGAALDAALEAARLKVAGLTPRPPGPGPSERPPSGPRRPQPAAASAVPAHKPAPDLSSASRRPLDGPAPASPGAARPGAGPSRFPRATRGLVGPAARQRARAGEARDAAARQGVTTIKAVTDRIAGWAGHFLEAGWDRLEVAELFDVCPDALLNALDPQEARA